MPKARSLLEAAANDLLGALRKADDRGVTHGIQVLTPWLHAEVKRAGARGTEIEEIAQDTWVAVVAAAGSLRWDTAMLAWIAAVARHRVVSMRRSQRRRDRLDAARGIGMGRAIVGEDDDVLAIVRGREAAEAVRRAVEAMPTTYREVMRLHLFEGLAPREIADRLRMGRVAVRVRLVRGFRWLRRTLPNALALIMLVALARGSRSQAPVWLGALAVVAIGVATSLQVAQQSTVGPMLAPFEASSRSDDAAAGAPSIDGSFAAVRQVVVDGRRDFAVRVVDAAGAPVPGVGVTVGPNGGVDPLLGDRCASTDAAGIATFAGNLTGPIKVRCDRGVATVVVAGDRHSVELRVGGGHDVRGRVVDATGRPIAAARVWLAGSGQDRRKGAEVTVTAADGSFWLREVPLGAALAVRADGFAGSPILPVDGPDIGAIRLTEAGGGVAVEVVGVDGSPCADAVVVLGFSDIDSLPNTPPFLARTDGDGIWSSRAVTPGCLPMVVKAPGAAPLLVPLTIEPGVTTRLRVRLQRGAVLRGRVVDATGAAVAGARIACTAEAAFAGVDALSGEDGTFCFGALPCGEIELRAHTEACAPVVRKLSLRDDAEPVVLELDRLPLRRGRVESAAGEPLVGYVLSLGDCTAVVDAHGGVALGVDQATDWRAVALRAPAWPRALQIGDLLRDAGDGGFVLRVPTEVLPTAWLHVRMVAEGGAPLADARVLAAAGAGCWAAAGCTDAAGWFHYGPLAAGTYRVSVAARDPELPALATESVQLADGEVRTVECTAASTGRVAVAMQFEGGRRPKAPVALISSDRIGRCATLYTAVGEQVLLPGDYELQAMGEDFVWQACSFRVVAGESTEVALTLVPAAKRYVSLRDLPCATGDELTGRFVDMASGASLGEFRGEVDGAATGPLLVFLPVGEIRCEAVTAAGDHVFAQFAVADLQPCYDVLRVPVVVTR